MNSINDLRTPSLIIDLPKLKENAQAMIRRAKSHGVRLRPHVKTHKTIEGARFQLGNEFNGITVSTMAEAEYYSRYGFDDITYAFPITSDKLSQCAEIAGGIRHFNILLDQPQTLKELEKFAESNGILFSAYLAVDAGNHREGVQPDESDSVTLAKELYNSEHIDFRGILTHAGQSYHCHNVDEIITVAEKEREIMVGFARKLRAEGIACPEVSVGATPTCVHTRNMEGITEIRPGNYIFFDKFQADIGSCSLDECAAMVLSRIVGHYPARNQMIVDAGALALSKDPGADHMHETITYGHVVDHPELKILGLSQEHGIIRSEDQIPFDKFPVGSQIKIIPNHSCLTAALFPEYYILENDKIIDQWQPVRGW